MEKEKYINKLRLLATLFKHDVKGQKMTYIFIIDEGNEIKRARVPIKNGVPQIKKGLKWKDFSFA